MSHNEHHFNPAEKAGRCLYCAVAEGQGHGENCRKQEIVQMTDLCSQMLKNGLTGSRAERRGDDGIPQVIACSVCGRTGEGISSKLGCFCPGSADEGRFKAMGVDDAMELLESWAEENGFSSLCEEAEKVLDAREETDEESEGDGDESSSSESDSEDDKE